jgi:hypothetical protein
MKLFKFHILFSLSLFLLVGSWYRKSVFDHKLNEITQKLILDKKTDAEKITSILNYCYTLKTTSIRNHSYSEINTLFSGKKQFLAMYYKTVPVNLIPSYYVARYGLTYSGPCGAKSKLLLNLLESAGYECRLAEVLSAEYQPIHSIVEIKQNNIWTPLDPTLNLYFRDEQGKFIETGSLNNNSSIYNSKIVEMLTINGPQNQNDYNYVNVKEVTVYHYMHSLMKATRVIRSDDRTDKLFHAALLAQFPEGLVHYELGTPHFYTNPVTIPIYFFALVLIASILFYRRKERAMIQVKERTKLPEPTMSCVE